MDIAVEEFEGKFYISTVWEVRAGTTIFNGMRNLRTPGSDGFRYHWSSTANAWTDRSRSMATAFATEAAAERFLRDHRAQIEATQPS
jgi:hypothetical protein